MAEDSGALRTPARPDYSRFWLLGPEQRWEFVRRNPIYLRHWREANDWLASQGGVGGGEKPPWLLALHEMGMTGGCPPPFLRSEDLPGLAAAQGHQHAGPLTLRFLLQPLLSAPTSVKTQIADLLRRGGGMEDLLRLESPDLDQELPWVMRIDARAPLRAIHASVKEFVKRHKEALGAKESRRRDDVVEDYLAAWDAREGWVEGVYDAHAKRWAGGRYDASKEKRLREMAVDFRKSVDTVRSRYESAFRIITGHDYDPDLWLVLFGPLKLPVSKLAGWRKKHGRSAGLKTVTEAALYPPTSEGRRRGGLDGLPGAGADELAYVDVKMDIEGLAREGKTEAEIAASLEVEPAVVRWFLGRQADGL
jgi:hypothetical protein